MKKITKAQIIEILSTIDDLSRGKDIYNSGIVTDISIKDNNVQVTLEVESHRAKAFEVIRSQVEKTINGIPDVTSCTVILTAHSLQNSKQNFDSPSNEDESKKSEKKD